jgi:adenosylhomocysteine nucleosidase
MKIGIIGAMDEEVAMLRSKLEGPSDASHAGFEIASGRYGSVEISLLKSGIGKVNTAIGTTILMENYAPDYIINTGSAGGFHPELEVGDLVISSEIRHHDVDVTAFDYEYGQVPGLPACFLPDQKLIAAAQRAVADVGQVKHVHGLIATGDSFMCDPERVAQTRARFPQMAAVEMEAAAIAQVCHHYQVPFVIIRSLSDIAGKESPHTFEQYLEKAAKHSAELVMAMVKELA